MYFKTNNPAVLTAYNEFRSAHTKLKKQAELFAEQFDAEPVILADSDSIYFAGLKFKNPSQVNFDIWRKPDRTFKSCSLRVKPLNKHATEEFNITQKKWNDLYQVFFKDFEGQYRPTVNKEPFYNSLGVNSGDLFFSSLQAFLHDGNVYINTGLSIKFVEIVGSEYEAAKLKMKELEKDNAVPA